MPVKCRFYRQCKDYANAVVPHSKMPLCKKHFVSYIQDRVKKTIEKFNLIKPESSKEKILIALSGGKDSQTLLSILGTIYKDQVPIEGLYIQVGDKQQFFHDSLSYVQKVCKRYEIPLNTFSIKDALGYNIDDVHNYGRRIGGKHRRNRRFRGECSYCGLFKRYYINHYAYKNGFSKVATGHNLTDEATQLVTNFFNGDKELMSRAGPITITDMEGLVPRIKPLYYIYEREIFLYSYFENIPHKVGKCPYSMGSTMHKIKHSMSEIEEFRRGNMMRLVKRYQRLLKPILFDSIPERKLIENYCKTCGMPTYLNKCSFCKTTDHLKRDLMNYHIITGD